MKKLNVGCGLDYRPGWVNLDNAEVPKVDVVHDLKKLPLPFKENEFDLIYVSHVIEHFDINCIIALMNEFHRILKPEGVLHVRVPYYNHPSSINPMDHKTCFTFNSFSFFTPGNYVNVGECRTWNIMSEKGHPTVLGRLIPNIPLKKIRKKCHNDYVEVRTITLREILSHVLGYIIKELEILLKPIK